MFGFVCLLACLLLGFGLFFCLFVVLLLLFEFWFVVLVFWFGSVWFFCWFALVWFDFLLLTIFLFVSLVIFPKSLLFE